MINSQTKTPLKPKRMNTSNYTSFTSKPNSTLSPSHNYFEYNKIDKMHNTNQRSSVSKCQHCTSSGCSSNKPSGVSYAQLQIILQNIKKIKEKANKDLSGQQKLITQQQKQILELTYKVNRYENIEETIKKEREMIHKNFQSEILKKQAQLRQNEQQIKKIQWQFQTVLKEKQDLAKQINQYQLQLSETHHITSDYKANYDKLMTQLNISNLQKFIDQVKSRYSSINGMFEHISILQTKFEQQQKLQQHYQHSIQDLKAQIQHSTTIQTHLISQKNKIQEQLACITQQHEQLHATNDQLRAYVEELQHKVTKNEKYYQSEFKNMEEKKNQQIRQLQHQLQELEYRRVQLEEKLMGIKSVQKNNEDEQKFKQIVDAVCNDWEDYENITKRMQYLQKFRNQYYLMVNKIQFLSRMLDE